LLPKLVKSCRRIQNAIVENIVNVQNAAATAHAAKVHDRWGDSTCASSPATNMIASS
jgi:hypothetical protein